MAALVSTGCALGLSEISLRLMGVSYPQFYQLDPVLGFGLRPGAQGRRHFEREVDVVINSHGMRDEERGLTKPANTVRIAGLGDSFTEAMQVPLQDTFLAYLERHLGKYPAFRGKNVEVLNFGVGGYGTGQEYLQLEDRVWRFQPDIVLLALLTANDIRNNSRDLEGDRTRPFFLLAGDGLVLDNSFRNSPFYLNHDTPIQDATSRLVNRSHLLQLLREGRNVLRRRQLYPETGSTRPREGGIRFDPEVYTAHRDPKWRDAWQVTERLLLKMRDSVHRHGADFFVVILNNKEQVLPSPEGRRAVRDLLGGSSLDYPDRRLTGFLQSHGVRVLSLLDPFQRYAEERQVYLHGFAGPVGRHGGHWNSEGHRLAGELISQWLGQEYSGGRPSPATGAALFPASTSLGQIVEAVPELQGTE